MSERDDLVLDAIAGRRVTSSGWVRGNCPFCELRVGKQDRQQCLGLEVATGSWHCFRCGSAGLLQEVPEDVETLARKAPDLPDTMELPEGFLPLYAEPGLSFPFTDGARAYLEAKPPVGRGLPRAIAKAAGIGVVFSGRYRGRVVVPILDVNEHTLVGWSARSYVGDPLRYLYPPGMERRSILYNGAALWRDVPDPVFVVEGVFDALPLWPDAVACLGKPSPPQVEAMIASKRPIVVLLDGDAWRESLALMLRLRLHSRNAASIRLPPAMDPGKLGETVAGVAALRRAGARALEKGAQVVWSEAA